MIKGRRVSIWGADFYCHFYLGHLAWNEHRWSLQWENNKNLTYVNPALVSVSPPHLSHLFIFVCLNSQPCSSLFSWPHPSFFLATVQAPGPLPNPHQGSWTLCSSSPTFPVLSKQTPGFCSHLHWDCEALKAALAKIDQHRGVGFLTQRVCHPLEALRKWECVSPPSSPQCSCLFGQRLLKSSSLLLNMHEPTSFKSLAAWPNLCGFRQKLQKKPLETKVTSLPAFVPLLRSMGVPNSFKGNITRNACLCLCFPHVLLQCTVPAFSLDCSTTPTPFFGGLLQLKLSGLKQIAGLQMILIKWLNLAKTHKARIS